VSGSGRLKLLLTGDVMTGRGVDQALPHSCPPRLYEPVVISALDYVTLAERANGPIRRPVDYAYVWGDALAVFEQQRPEARIVNLETSITTSDEPDPKGINYRMHPANIPVLTAAKIDCCVLANNHVLDWGRAGLGETLETLARAGIRSPGAGPDLRAAQAPAVLAVGGESRVLVFGFGATDAGIPEDWSAGADRAGVHLLPDFSGRTVERIAGLVRATRRPGDVVVASVHWGDNWGYDIPVAHRRFAHGLIERAEVDAVHGHSSHHPKAIEIYRERPIFYGCGDLLNDYEGIPGNEEFRDDLVLLYFVTFEVPGGRLARLELTPLRIRNFRLNQPSASDRAWLRGRLDRECSRFRHRVIAAGDAYAVESG
jgi:poly-gamma-glutamate capsule biosynthesis protein CapA/YwtB (metallophosphatase superfamily)